MKLPESLQISLDKEIGKISLQQLAACAKELSLCYREKKGYSHPFTLGHRLAYLATRVPATYAAISHVLFKVNTPQHIESMLDVGAGPGTGTWAAREIFSALKKATLIEKDPHFIELGKRIAPQAGEWLNVDVNKHFNTIVHDLVLMSYALGELPDGKQQEIIHNLWKCTGKILVVIEPGTPEGFERIRKVRETLINDLGAFIVAPCPHAEKCPMKQNDWCHFSVRAERSYQHRYAKDATLPFEDEKFSYIIASKSLVALTQSRILRHPLKRKGHVSLTLCTAEGIKENIITKKDKEKYHSVRKLSWGDNLNTE